MNPNKVKKEDGKAFAAINIAQKRVAYIDPCYEIKSKGERTIEETGLLCVFALQPTVCGLPDFVGRWDERAHTLDIDIRNVSKKEERRFKHSIGGYSGHHTKGSGQAGCFDVELSIPGRKICEMTIYFGLHRKLELFDTLSLSDHLFWDHVAKKHASWIGRKLGGCLTIIWRSIRNFGSATRRRN
jgi:hypothetical protein